MDIGGGWTGGRTGSDRLLRRTGPRPDGNYRGGRRRIDSRHSGDFFRADRRLAATAAAGGVRAGGASDMADIAAARKRRRARWAWLGHLGGNRVRSLS